MIQMKSDIGRPITLVLTLIIFREVLPPQSCRLLNVPFSLYRNRIRADGRGSITGRGNDFCLLQSVETGSGVHQTSYAMSTECSFPGGKAVAALCSPLTSM
jgi:hypothetical protein